jgi:hypothetical protein
MLGHQVFHDFLLPVDRNRSTDQRCEIDVMTLSGELKVNSVVHESVAGKAVTDPQSRKRLDGSLLEHPGADAAENILARPVFQDHEVNASAMKGDAEQ